jgi:hypothetical protein
MARGHLETGFPISQTVDLAGQRIIARVANWKSGRPYDDTRSRPVPGTLHVINSSEVGGVAK